MVALGVMHILIVDDHAMIRDALSLGLRACGHEVAQAANGAAALTAMAQRLPDVLVTDLDMPGMGGVELIRRARRAYPELPIVAMTAGGGENLAALELDGACKLQKPFTAAQLISAITRARDAA